MHIHWAESLKKRTIILEHHALQGEELKQAPIRVVKWAAFYTRQKSM